MCVLFQDIANDFQYVTSDTGRQVPMTTRVQNVTLNSGRMIQVVVQAPADQVRPPLHFTF